MLLSLLLSTFFTVVQNLSITGKGVTIDDETGKEKSEVTVFIKQNRLYARIDRLLLEEDQGKRCTECKDDKQGQPIEGMLIINGLEPDGDSWSDGEILDPANGKYYDCTLKLEDKNTLLVRGYIGFSFIGRTQQWKRKQ
ncbi:MAG: DUF2147 domain-containing protein [Bacteroidetes bacterium]|nr:DUF2147 domain-containing protein [Bacteroidota bacterium]